MRKVVSADMEQLNQIMTFSLYSIANDREAIFFDNFLKVFKALNKALIDDRSSINTNLIIASKGLIVATMAFRNFWNELISSDVVQDKLKAGLDETQILIQSLTEEQAEVATLFILSGSTETVTVLKSYMTGIVENIFQNSVSSALSVHVNLMVASVDLFMYYLSTYKTTLIEDDVLNVNAYTAHPPYIQAIKTLLSRMVIIETAEEE